MIRRGLVAFALPLAAAILATPSSAPRAEGRCVVPVAPKHLVLKVERVILPHGTESRHEATQVTTDGVCEPDKECARVAAATTARLLDLVRSALVVRHDPGAGSPHYGSRFIEARFDGGACSVADGATERVTSADGPIFSKAFDAIVEAAAAVRPKPP